MKRFPVTPASNIICLIVLAIIFIINLVSAIGTDPPDIKIEILCRRVIQQKSA